MERGRRENVGAKGLHCRRVKPTVFFEKQQKGVAGLNVVADVFDQKLGYGFRPEPMYSVDKAAKLDLDACRVVAPGRWGGAVALAFIVGIL